jgi:hypothetical protein
VATLRLTNTERLEVLAAAVIDYLNDPLGVAGLDDDSNPPHTELFNLASALVGPLRYSSRAPDAAALKRDDERHADEEATAILVGADSGALAVVRRSLIPLTDRGEEG